MYCWLNPQKRSILAWAHVGSCFQLFRASLHFSQAKQGVDCHHEKRILIPMARHVFVWEGRGRTFYRILFWILCQSILLILASLLPHLVLVATRFWENGGVNLSTIFVIIVTKNVSKNRIDTYVFLNVYIPRVISFYSRGTGRFVYSFVTKDTIRHVRG